jgi:hypothetical protein
MVKLQGFLLILNAALTLYAFVDCAMRDQTQIRRFRKPVWLLIILLLGAFGPIFYLVGGRIGSLNRTRPNILKPKPKMLPPDDDPDFLRGL